MITVLVHIANADPVKMDMDDMPDPRENAIVGKNPREKTDKEVGWLEEGVTTVVFPWWRITFIEVLPQPGEEQEFPLPFRND